MKKFISGMLLVVVLPLVLAVSVKSIVEFDDKAKLDMCNSTTKKDIVMDSNGHISCTYRRLTLDECKELIFDHRGKLSMLVALSLVTAIGLGIYHFSNDSNDRK